jgi:3-hydroxyacyl-CoA dehydrogenase
MKQISDIKKITVIGAGTMGPGIAQIFALGGYEVAMVDVFPEALEKGKVSLKNSLDTFVEEGIATSEQAAAALAKVSFSTSMAEGVVGADMVMECVVEKREVKQTVFAELDELLPMDTIIASNTSALNIFELIPARRLPMSIIAHWYAPPQMIPLVEVVKSDEAPQALADLLVELLEQCGKTAVPMKKFIQGYIVNRLQMCLNQEVFNLLDSGICTAEDIDRAAKTSFIPRAMVLGLCKRMDFGGLTMTANNFANHSYTMPPPKDMPSSLAAHIEKGELGIKTGKGFYDYTDMDMDELLAKRDRQLFEAFRLQKAFMDDPV